MIAVVGTTRDVAREYARQIDGAQVITASPQSLDGVHAEAWHIVGSISTDAERVIKRNAIKSDATVHRSP